MKKIEKFLLFCALLVSIVYPGSSLNPPKNKDYFGRIILSIFGLIIFLLLLSLVFILVVLPTIEHFK